MKNSLRVLKYIKKETNSRNNVFGFIVWLIVIVVMRSQFCCQCVTARVGVSFGFKLQCWPAPLGRKFWIWIYLPPYCVVWIRAKIQIGYHWFKISHKSSLRQINSIANNSMVINFCRKFLLIQIANWHACEMYMETRIWRGWVIGWFLYAMALHHRSMMFWVAVRGV